MEENPPKPRNRFAAILLSVLLPGLGQLFTSQGRKSLGILGGLLFLLLLSKSRVAVLLPSLYLGLAGAGFAFWLYALVDSARAAPVPRPRRWYAHWYVYLLAIFNFSIAFAMIEMTRSVQPFVIPANSMSPTILHGDRILVDLKAFSRQPPAPGDLAVFRFPKDRRIHYVKRIVGVPGDTIEIREKRLFRNGKAVPVQPAPAAVAGQSLKGGWFDDEDDYKVLGVFEEELGSKHLIAVNTLSHFNADFGPVKVPEGEYFTLGDNRDKSSDSRFWGNVPARDLVGKPEAVWFSRDPVSHRVRWERMGMHVE